MAPASSVVLTREQLYERIWAGPTTKLAKELGVSDVAVGNACKRHNIPKPPLGYWAKKAHGKAPPQPPLPACADPGLQKVYFTPVPMPPAVSDPECERKIQTPDLLRVIAELDAAGLDWQVPLVPTRLLPVVRATQTGLRVNSKRARHSYARPGDQLVFPESSSLIACVNVAPSSINRAIAFLNALLEVLIAAGFAFGSSKDVYRERLVVELLGVRRIVAISETSKRHPHEPTNDEIKRAKESDFFKWPKYDYLPTGRLKVSIEREHWTPIPVSWADTDASPIESHLRDIVHGLLLSIDDELVERKRKHEETARQLEETRRAEETEKQRQIEEKREQLFIEEIERWELARRMRRYIRAAEANAVRKHGRINPQSQFATALAWAKAFADRTDPQSPMFR